jgi:putative transposase
MYVILDVYSRYVVGWMLAHRQAATLAERLLADTITAQVWSPTCSPSTPTGAPR